MNADHLMTPAEVGEWLKVTPNALAQWRFRGAGPRYVKLGRHVRYQRSDITAWIDSNLRESTY